MSGDGEQPAPTPEEEAASRAPAKAFAGLDPKGDEPGHSSDNLKD